MQFLTISFTSPVVYLIRHVSFPCGSSIFLSVGPVLTNTYQSNTYRKDLSWPHFNDEARVQEKQQVKGQHSCIFVFVVCLTIPSSN